MIDLDANFLIGALENNALAVQSLQKCSQASEIIGVSVIAWSELLCGPLTSSQAEQARLLVNHVTALTQADASLAAELFNRTGRRPRSLADCMIAATAIRRGAKLATFDRAGFEPFVAFRLQLQGL